MAWIAGVDGCKGGWIAVYEDTDSGKLECCVEAKFEDLMAHHDLDVVAVDMPIGLCDGGGRACDAAARTALSPLRHPSIFSAPAAGVIDLFRKMKPAECEDRRAAYKCANELNKKLTGKGLSQQSWSIVPKISELDCYLAGHVGERGRIHEAHPEVSFAAMNACENDGACRFNPMEWHKATFGGSVERRALLRRVFGNDLEELEAAAAKLVGKGAALDDFYDALACLWTARRIQKGPDGPARALCRMQDIRALPDGAPSGANGLPMRIVY